MKPLSRRDFLRMIAAGTGALTMNQFIAACGLDDQAIPPTRYPSLTPLPTSTHVSPTEHRLDPSQPDSTATEARNTTTATEEQPTATATPPAVPDLVVARNGEPDQLVRRALTAMGGMGRFVHKGADVIIKPNICVSYYSYEYAATTNPWVVATLVNLAYEAGARRVRVMDHTWKREMTEAYLKSGIQGQVEAAGGQMEWMPSEKFVPTEVPEGVDLDSLNIYDEILNADVLINVPIAKHHQDAGLTLGMKNLMGTMDSRLMMHANLGQRIADLSTCVRPTLNVMDAVRMMMRNGPISGYLGDVKQLDTVLVSQDIVALDSYAASFFDKKPEDIEHIRLAAKMGVGCSDLSNLRIEEFNVN